MEKKTGLKWTRLSILVVLSAWSCGGSGGGGGTPPQIMKPANLDQCAAETTEDIIRSFADPFSSGVSDVDTRSAGFVSGAATLAGQGAMGHVQDALRSEYVVKDQDVVRAGVQSENHSCIDGGTFHFSGNWTGPEPYPDQFDGLCQISDLTVSFTYSDCESNGDMKNGNSISTFSGTACRPTAIAMRYSDYRIEDSVSSYFFEYLDFDLEYADLRWEEGTDPVAPMSYKLTLNGAIETSFKSMEFYQYALAVSNDGSVIVQSGNGAVTGGNIDGWVTVTTVSPVRRQRNTYCPYEGYIQLSGAGGITVDVVYNNDGSMTIGDQHYGACDAPELMRQCQ